jgi:hypothetical protein
MAKYVLISADLQLHVASDCDPDYTHCGERIMMRCEGDSAAKDSKLCGRCRRATEPVQATPPAFSTRFWE